MNHQQNAPATRRSPRLLARTAAAALVVGLGACAPIATEFQYSPSDGLRVEVSEAVHISNLLVIAGDEGDAGALQAGITNRGTEDTTVRIGELSIDVDAGSSVLIGENGERMLLDSVSEPPGANVELVVSTDDTEGVVVPVPVLDGTLSQYTDLVPTS